MHARVALSLACILAPLAAMAAQEVHAQNPWYREMAAGLAVDQQMVQESLLSGTAICQAVYNSLLIPLRAGEDAAAVGDSVEVIADSPEATVIRVTRGGMTWTMTMDRDGARVESAEM